MNSNILALFIPWLYTLVTRCDNSVKKVLDYILLNDVIPSLILLYFIFKPSIIFIVIAAILVYTYRQLLYEVGYIVNDLIALREKDKGTMRFNVQLIREYLPYAIVMRSILAVAIIYTSYFFKITYNILLLALYTLLLIAVFIVHNLVTDTYFRIGTYTALQYIRYTPMIFTIFAKFPEALLYILLITPFVYRRSVKYVARKVFGSEQLYNSPSFDLSIHLMTALIIISILIQVPGYIEIIVVTVLMTIAVAFYLVIRKYLRS